MYIWIITIYNSIKIAKIQASFKYISGEIKVKI